MGSKSKLFDLRYAQCSQKIRKSMSLPLFLNEIKKMCNIKKGYKG